MNRLTRFAAAIGFAALFSLGLLVPASALVPGTYTGSVAPTNPQQGQTWIDTSVSSSAPIERMYDGAQWLAKGTLDSTKHLYSLTPSTLTSFGGVQSLAPATSLWVNGIVGGIPSVSQPSFTDLLGSVTCTQLPALTGDVTTTAGTCVTAIGTNKVSNTQLGQAPTLTMKANATGATANESDVSISAFLDANFGATQGLELCRGAALWGPIASGATGTVKTGNGVGVCGTYQAAGAATAAPRSNVRQTVQGGPASSTGVPSFMPATSASLSVTTTGLSASAPLYVASAQGLNGTGQNDLIFPVVSNLTFTCTASTSCYEFVNASTGAASTQTLMPIYQCGGALSVTNGQFSFDYCGGGTGGTGTQAGQPMVGYLGNGTNAVETPLVSIGECTAGTSALTACIAYAYNGYYDSGYTATLPAGGVVTTKAHNIGVVPVLASMPVEGTATDANTATVAGDDITGMAAGNTTSVTQYIPQTFVANRLSVQTGSPSPWAIQNKSTLINAIPASAANFKWKIVVRRAFGGS